jgi:hypothetical protein
MKNNIVGNLGFSQILERKLDFLLHNEIAPWDGEDKSDLGERDALQQMLDDSKDLSEQGFEHKYKTELEKLKARSAAKEFSVKDGDDYYESFNNTIVSILELINPLNLYDLSDD